MITFTQGDTATLMLTATDGNGNPINLTGASFTSYIRGPNGVNVMVSFPNGQHTIVNAALGQFSLALSSSDTANCGIGSNKEIITQIVLGGTTIYYHGQNVLNVLASVPLQ